MGEKIELRKKWRELYQPSAREPVIVEVPAFTFAMLDGHGDPNHSSEYQAAVNVLFALSYGLKFAVKRSLGIDYGVMPLEGLWWVEDMARFSLDRKDEWSWTMLILQPEWVTPQLFEQVRQETSKKKDLPMLAEVRLETYLEGTSVQIVHIGPFKEEKPNVDRMHAFAVSQGYHPDGKHHEIYLSDVRKAAPEKWKTILRQPISH